MTAAEQALAAFRDRLGHFPNCQHRQPSHGASHQAGVDCPNDHLCGGDGPPDPGYGLGCSKKCHAANAALGLLGSPLLAAIEGRTA